MDWVFFRKTQDFLSPSQQPFSLPHTPSPPSLPPPPPPSLQSVNTFNKVSPSILLVIIIIAIIFFISGLLHLLVRFLFRPSYIDSEDLDNVTALQGQLQQLFDLHDSGVDQTYIDTLPVFQYKSIIGLKNPFDCAVCLCEFEDDDKLRLLPICSHAFHLECIDTWLLSHSTCPLCRRSLLPEFPYHNTSCSPLVFVLESGDESSREMVSDREFAIASSVVGTNTDDQTGCYVEDELESSCNDLSKNSDKEDVESQRVSTVVEEKVIPVKLGKFRNVDNPTIAGDPQGSSTSNVDSRRCFSMGSFEYVLDESSSLQISIKPPARKHTSKKPAIPLTPRHKAAMSECDCHSTREGFKEFDTLRSIEIHSSESNGNSIGRSKKDSFSFSKAWLRTKKEKTSSVGDLSRRASSSRFPLQKNESMDDTKSNAITSSRTVSDINVSRWESSASEIGVDEEIGSGRGLDSQLNMPSFRRRTLLWLVGKQNKVVHSSSPNV